MTFELPPCPSSLKGIQHYLKTAAEHEMRDMIITYWCRLYALQTALKLDKKSDEARLLLVKLMDWLEKQKKELASNECITNDIAAQAYLENYALKLFLWADNQDQSGVYNKNIVKAFYTAGMLMDVLNTFGELTDDIVNKCKYAKWKAAYIHNCLKTGETPIPGPANFEDEEGEFSSEINDATSANIQQNFGFNLPIPSASNSDQFIGSDNFSHLPNSAVPHVPPTTPQNNVQPSISNSTITTECGVKLDSQQITRAQKYCKWAASALNYDDVAEAISNLQKALTLLQTGEDS